MNRLAHWWKCFTELHVEPAVVMYPTYFREMLSTELCKEDGVVSMTDEEIQAAIHITEFDLGDKVFKPEGYRFEGVVVGIAYKLNGQTRYVVENTDGLLHIFRASQLRKAEGGKV